MRAHQLMTCSRRALVTTRMWPNAAALWGLPQGACLIVARLLSRTNPLVVWLVVAGYALGSLLVIAGRFDNIANTLTTRASGSSTALRCRELWQRSHTVTVAAGLTTFALP